MSATESSSRKYVSLARGHTDVYADLRGLGELYNHIDAFLNQRAAGGRIQRAQIS
jgi:hypothetical protein